MAAVQIHVTGTREEELLVALDIDTDIKLSIPAAFSRDPVLDIRAGHGLERIYRAQNTFIEKLRGPLVSDTDIELKTTGQSGFYRARVHGNGGGIANDPATAHVNATVDAAGNLTTRVQTGLSIITHAHTVGATEAWETFASDLGINDSAEYEEIEVDISSISGAITLLHSVSIHYKRARTVLLDGPRTDGLFGMDVSRAAGEKTLSAPRLHHLHATARQLIKIRQGTIVQKAFFDDANGYQPAVSGPLMWVAFAPHGVTKGRFYLRRNRGAAGSGTWTLKSLDARFNVIDSENETIPSTSIGWTTARDLTLLPGLNFISLEGTGFAQIHSICGWLRDAAYPA